MPIYSYKCPVNGVENADLECDGLTWRQSDHTCYTLDDDSVSLISVIFPFRFMIMTFTSEGTTKKGCCGLVIIIIII